MHLDHIKMVPETGRHAEQVPSGFFYSRIVEKNQDDFKKINPREEFNRRVRELIEEQRDQISEQFEEFGEPVSTLAQDVLFSNERITVGFRGRHPSSGSIYATKYTGEKTEEPVLLSVLSEDTNRHRRPDERSKELRIALLSKSADDAEKMVGFFGSEIQEIQTYVGEYADMKIFRNGGEIVHDYFDERITENSNLEGWHQDMHEDDFEEEVFMAVRKLTSVALDNIRIEVDVGDNPDFDVAALPLGGFGTNYAIEVKNYLQEDNDEVDEAPATNKDAGELRSELIRKPKEFAEQADCDLITIVKGLSGEQYDDLNRLAESSSVVLLNDDNYEEELRKLLVEESFKEMSEYVV
jgi:hypothetical protein